MENTYSYPTQYELLEVFNSIPNKDFVREFAQRRGIFITNSRYADLTKELSFLFLENDELEEIRREAYNANHSHSLHGFTVTSEDKDFNLKKVYEFILENDNSKRKKDMSLSALRKVKSTTGKSVYKGTIKYRRRKVGRIEFLQYDESSFDFYFIDNGNGSWQVEVDCSKSNDAKEIKDLLQYNTNDKVDYKLIDQGYLSTEKTILFFDSLSKKGMGPEWSCTDVKHLTVRKGKDEGLEEDDDFYMDNVDEVDDSDKSDIQDELIEIKQAILNGQKLRGNTFVKQFEESGYRFTAMTYQFDHIKDPYRISIKAEFKGRPKVFEVSIKAYEENEGATAIPTPKFLGADENREIRSKFWNNASMIYDECRLMISDKNKTKRSAAKKSPVKKGNLPKAVSTKSTRKLTKK